MRAQAGQDSARRQRMRRAMAPLAERLDLERQLVTFEPYRWRQDLTGAAVLHLDDFSGIPFLVDITGVEEYQHRARLRARAGEMYVASTPVTPGYEEYCRSILGLDAVEFQQIRSESNPMYLAAACRHGDTWQRLVSVGRAAGGLILHPFMGIDDVWELAAAAAAATEVPVKVLAPPPPVTWIANDKALFDEVVERALGREWLVETYAAADIVELGRYLRKLATSHGRVALKRLRCASAMGNAVFESAALRQRSASDIEATIAQFLERTEWRGDEEVLAVAWEDATHSPSTQLWIPPPEIGVPVLDGIYEQLLVGERRVFMGSRPSQLPAAVNRLLASASLEVALALQSLGYVGRCSFDLLVVEDPDAEFRLRFTECNGRWGGTSTPMALLDRLFPAGRPPYRARDFVDRRLIGASFEELLARVGEAAWDHRTQSGKFLFYNTGPLTGFGKLDVIALGADQAAADLALEEELPRLWGL